MKTPLAMDLGCPPSAHGSVDRHVWIELSDASTLLDCALDEFIACRPGHVRYEMRVGRGGELLALSVSGEAPSSVKTCVEVKVREAVLLPAADCQNEPVATTQEGEVRWGPEHGLRGSQSILGAVWPCAEAELSGRMQHRGGR